jgi:hypothetical protein
MVDESLIRQKIVDLAVAETKLGIAASLADPSDSTKRKGWQRLKEYFDTAAPSIWSDNVIENAGASGLPDWCGIGALWAVKTGGAPGVGTWIQGSGISSVSGMSKTDTPLPGDITAQVAAPQHMSLVHSVDGPFVKTIDFNDVDGTVTGPSSNKAKTSFTAGFFTAFPSPVGKWRVQVGVWTWLYRFKADGSAAWSDIRQPPTESGTGQWEKTGSVMKITWAQWRDARGVLQPGGEEHWDLPLQPKGQQGELVGQGRIISADRVP